MRDSLESDRANGTRGRATSDHGRSNGSGGGSAGGRGNGGGRGPASSGSTAARLSGNKAVLIARGYLEELTGKQAESVSGLSRIHDGWVIMLEVVELERVPSSTDILATYRVQVNGEGELMGCDRVHRYYRNQPGGE